MWSDIRCSSWGVLAFSLSVTACDSCGSKKPYTPFTLGSGTAAAPAAVVSSAAPPPAASAAGPFEGRKEELAPPEAARWALGDRVLEAPQGRLFTRAVRADFDGDGKEDVAAWTVPAAEDPSAAPGELWYFPAAGQTKLLLPLPSFLPTGPGCNLTTSVAQTGPQTLTLDATSTCQARLVARSPVRAVSVLRPAAERPLVLTLRMAEPAADELLTVAVDSTDRDADGRDDVGITFTVQSAGSTRPASARMAWLDRAAGASREANEPARSLMTAASTEVARAKGKSTSRTTSESVGNLRRLYFSLCAESGTPRVFDEDGAPLGCGNLQTFVDRLALAELGSALTRRNFVEALGVFTRDGWYHSKVSETQRKTLQKDLGKALPTLQIGQTMTLGAQPVPRVSLVRYSPLRFEPSGHLSVRTPHGLVRTTPDGSHSEELAPDQPGGEPWPLEVSREDGTRWTGLTYACDRSEVLLTLGGADPHAAQPLVTRLLSPRPGSCKGGTPPRTAPPVAISFGSSGLDAIVGGLHIQPKAAADPAPGSPRSPDGKYVVVWTPLGMLVASADHGELWSVTEPTWSQANASDCVVANEARAIACVLQNRVRLVLRP